MYLKKYLKYFMSIYVFKIHFNIFQYLVFVLKYFLTEYLVFSI